MNEDRVAPGKGFGTHGHDNMAISYVLSGALEHDDSMGTGKVLRSGEFQRVSAASGITHSEFNSSQTESVLNHYLEDVRTDAKEVLRSKYRFSQQIPFAPQYKFWSRSSLFIATA